MHTTPASRGVHVGIIANPVSARDIRRVIANAGNLQLVDRVNMILRTLVGLAAGGVQRVAIMPDGDGLCALLQRRLAQERACAQHAAAWPTVTPLAMPVTGTGEDSTRAARLLAAGGAAAIIVLGGDGTHRAVVAAGSTVAIAGLSSGTNNAYPQMREATLVGMAVGLHASGRIPPAQSLVGNKCLQVRIERGDGTVQTDLALVDVAVLQDRFIGAGAMWEPDALAALYLSFAEPGAVGLSAIGGLLQPLGRRQPGGLRVDLKPARATPGAAPKFLLNAPMGPGLLRVVPIHGWVPFPANAPQCIAQEEGTIALDGERILAFARGDRVSVTLRENAFQSVDVDACLRLAAARGLLRVPVAD